MRGVDPNNTNERKFWSKVDIKGPEECWNWKAFVAITGYGRFYLDTATIGAHRAAWIITYGPILDGKWILHKCDNRICVNPNHLYIGTGADNTQDRCLRNPESFFTANLGRVYSRHINY